jgi:hypothetical protein
MVNSITKNSIQTLFFPYEIGMYGVCLSGVTFNGYPVDIATSLRSIETRTLLPGGSSDGSISFSLSEMDDIALETLSDFYHLCRGPLLAFEIRDDHPLFADLLPPYLRKHFYPLWRFTEALSPTCDCDGCGWKIILTLKNVVI